MKLRINSILYLFIVVALSTGCKKIEEQEKYQSPEWLKGKLYTQILSYDNLQQFARCLEKTGYDSVIDKSGSYTVFAPSDEAFKLFFSNHPEYGNSIDDLPLEYVNRIVKYHIIQNAWSKVQIKSLNVDGWIDEDDPYNNKPWAFKFQTILKESNENYHVLNNRGNYTIVDSLLSNETNKVYTKTRKYIPIFFDEYFSLNELTTSDFEFYFGRTFEPQNMYVANAKIIGDEIFAENGFVYEVDRVIEPLKNAKDLLEEETGGRSYSMFLDLIYNFPEFQSNLEATYDQPEAKAGQAFDTLYNLTYDGLSFYIHDEICGPNKNNEKYTVRYQNGLMAPTNEAFQLFLDEIVTAASGYPHWAKLKDIPKEILQVIINTHMGVSPVYPSYFNKGYKNGESDYIFLDESQIADRKYGSNCTFIGLDKAIAPRSFTSVSAPVYLRPGYSTFMYAMDYSKILPAIKAENAEYSFFIISDNILRQDSSLMMEWDDKDLNRYHFEVYNRGSMSLERVPRQDLTRRLLNQVGTSLPRGLARKEFIENLAGNYIVFDNSENTVQGGKDNVYGYMGDSVITIYPELLEEPTDNGKTFTTTGWFHFPRGEMYSVLSSYPEFIRLLLKCGLANDKTFTLSFLTEGEYYTVFAPTDEALIEYGADTMSNESLSQLLKYHFVKGELIFTDGNKPSGLYETVRQDESSTLYNTYYSTIRLNLLPDCIDILNNQGETTLEIIEEEDKTNIMVVTDSDDESESILDYITTGVVHEIDGVLVKQ